MFPLFTSPTTDHRPNSPNQISAFICLSDTCSSFKVIRECHCWSYLWSPAVSLVGEEGFLCCGSDAGRTVKEGRVDRTIAPTTHIGEFYHIGKMGPVLGNSLLKTMKACKAVIIGTIAYIFSSNMSPFQQWNVYHHTLLGDDKALIPPLSKFQEWKTFCKGYK